MDTYQRQFVTRAYQGAEQSGHIFPLMAACEAALETRYGVSRLAIEGCNLFGSKNPVHPIYPYISFPTHEFNHEGRETTALAKFVKYPSFVESFKDRMATLQRLSPTYPHYAAALVATNPIDYVRSVSLSWSTDPKRADTAISIYHTYGSVSQ